MKNRISRAIGIAGLTLLIVFSLIQLKIQPVNAEGCPSEPFPGCSCDLIESVSVEYGGHTHWYCTYGCYCPGPGGGEPFYIEQTYDYWD